MAMIIMVFRNMMTTSIVINAMTMTAVKVGMQLIIVTVFVAVLALNVAWSPIHSGKCGDNIVTLSPEKF